MKPDGAKKRKRDGDSSGKPKKKVVLDAPVSAASVSSVLRAEFCPPVVGKEPEGTCYEIGLCNGRLTFRFAATTPGIEIPQKLAFQSYQARDTTKAKSKYGRTKELLLHSTSHQSLDYTAREEGSRQSAPLLNHFVGVYDPNTGKLEVIEAKRMVVRGLVRAKQVAESSAGENEASKVRKFYGFEKKKKLPRKKEPPTR